MSEIILTGIYPVNDYRSYLRHSDEVEWKYGLPDKKKYPMPDRDHVMSAIKFFNYVSPADEKELAKSIIARIKEYGITDINVGENNRFGKYYKPDYLEHHGILGMKWGVQNGPPYPLDASDHSASEKKAGWRKSLDKDSSKPANSITANKMIKDAGLRYYAPESKGKDNCYIYDDGRGNDNYRIFMIHHRGKDTKSDIEKKIATAKSLSDKYPTIQKNVNNACKQRIENIYGKDNLYKIVEKHAFESRLSGVQNMIVKEPWVIEAQASYWRPDDKNFTSDVNMSLNYDVKRHKAKGFNWSVVN